MSKSSNIPPHGDRKSPQLVLVGLDANDQRPKLIVHAVDRGGVALESARVDNLGNFVLSPKGLAAAARVLVGPADLDPVANRDAFAVWRGGQFARLLELGVIDLPQGIWGGWFGHKTCVSGTVRHCRWWPFIAAEFQRAFLSTGPAAARSLAEAAHSVAPCTTCAGGAKTLKNVRMISAPVAASLAVDSWSPVMPWRRCAAICDGVVEIYRRTCCSHPIVINVPDLDDIIIDIRDILDGLQPIPWPWPEPEPQPWRELPYLKDGAIDLRVLNARRDHHALTTLPRDQAISYLHARPYLWWHRTCSAPIKVASGFLAVDGTFSVCWRDWRRLLAANCEDQFAFVVKQSSNGNVVTIYDGLAANQWFDAGDSADLISHHPLAIGCGGGPDLPKVDGDYVMLTRIGATDSWNLKTPDATGWDRVAAPTGNDGLCFPAASPAAAVGTLLDRNWGGGLALEYHFSEGLYAKGARYYRVSVTAANASGSPTGARVYLPAPQWQKSTWTGTDLLINNVTLAPSPNPTSVNDIHQIPFEAMLGANQEWVHGSYHAYLDTTRAEFSDGRYLVTIELFDATGKLLHPNGTSAPPAVPHDDIAFSFRRWYQATGPTANVPFAALTHLFWWDNRSAQASIEDFLVNSADPVVDDEECQFLSAPGSATFSVKYRAFHPNALFLHQHAMTWHRGLNGPSGWLVNDATNAPSGTNAGGPGAVLAASSGTDTFAEMLGTKTRCAFTIALSAEVKTFNGSGTLTGLNRYPSAAVALQKT